MITYAAGGYRCTTTEPTELLAGNWDFSAQITATGGLAAQEDLSEPNVLTRWMRIAADETAPGDGIDLLGEWEDLSLVTHVNARRIANVNGILTFGKLSGDDSDIGSALQQYDFDGLVRATDLVSTGAVRAGTVVAIADSTAPSTPAASAELYVTDDTATYELYAITPDGITKITDMARPILHEAVIGNDVSHGDAAALGNTGAGDGYGPSSSAQTEWLKITTSVGDRWIPLWT